MQKKHFLLLSLLIAVLLLLAADNPPPAPASEETLADLEQALSHRLQSESGTNSLTLELFTPELDTAFTSPDGKSAVLWLALRDDSGRLLKTEPGLALAVRTNTGWQVLLPGDAGWEETLAGLPEGMLPLELSPAPKDITLDPIAIAAPLTGYYLPYMAGTARWLEGSISHFQSIPELGYPSCSEVYCRYAYDFTDAGHYPLLASKDGTVVGSRDTCSDGSPSCTNYIVLSNFGDQPYQIYLHLSHGTIPDHLSPGTVVQRGQYLGDTDDTGYSTSEHVHFMVTDSIWLGGDGYYWGRSIDIRFADVAINNGIPRTCYEVTHFPIYDGATQCLGNKSDPRNPANDWFVSGNVGAFPPAGEFIEPADGATVANGSNPLIDITVSASDDVFVTAVRLLARLDGQWVEVGPIINQPVQPGVYDWDVNLCALGPLNGPLEMALRIWDHEGNVAAVVDPQTIQVNHACPPPTSQLKPAETFNSTAVHLSWDASGAGAGIGSFDLQWRTVPGSWIAANLLSIPGNVRSTWFTGEAGVSYEFRLRARDKNGQPEPWPATGAAETSANLPATCIPDASEPDNDSNQANPLVLGAWAQGNLCGSGDPDWYQVEIVNLSDYAVSATSLDGGAAVKITVTAGDGQTVVANGQALGLSQGTFVHFQAAEPGSFYIKIEPLVTNLMGTDAVYGLNVSEVEVIYLPQMRR